MRLPRHSTHGNSSRLQLVPPLAQPQASHPVPKGSGWFGFGSASTHGGRHVDPAAHIASRSVSRADVAPGKPRTRTRSEEHTSELQSHMRISYTAFCLKKNTWFDTTL